MALDIPLHYYRLLHFLYQSQQKVYIQANAQLIFPAQDIARLVRRADHYLLTVNFLGLRGVDAPTEVTTVDPNSLTWNVCQQAVSHRCYELYYLAWRCTHPVLSVINSVYLQSIWTTCWFNRAQWQYGLRQLLSEYPYQVWVQRQRWCSVLSATIVGSSCKLGQNALLGDHLTRIESAIVIIVGPLTSSQLHHWLNCTWSQTIHQRLFAHHQNDELSIVWQCRQQHVPIGGGWQLGKDTIYLGF